MARPRILAILLFVALLAGFPEITRADRFYSVHLASYGKLENANRHVNQLKHRRDIVFWKEIQIPDKGRFYRVYVGRFSRRSDAVEFWNQLNSEGAVNYFGVYQFATPLAGADGKSSIDRSRSVEFPKDPIQEREPHDGPRFLDNKDGTVTDTWTGLMWVKNGWRLDLLSAVDWWVATHQCSRFRLRGYSDWRLPTVREWKSLIDPGQEHPALVTPHPFENIIAHMPYWTATGFHPPSGRETPNGSAARAYTVLMYYGTLNHQAKDRLAFVLPIRSIE
ncbi:hypothetical protein D3OALGA1CA_4415 [Olavius algarvensis associated proteobacterium Delta 3]|nr:hypothetical protein D3OALGA1CA_4415 [Olavius algarvensis associated proteobacterium Delta 3]